MKGPRVSDEELTRLHAETEFMYPKLMDYQTMVRWRDDLQDCREALRECHDIAMRYQATMIIQWEKGRIADVQYLEKLRENMGWHDE